jgi:hypothetical protein
MLGFLVWKKKRRGSGEASHGQDEGQAGVGLGKSELDGAAVAEGSDEEGGHGGKGKVLVNEKQTELDSSSFKGIEADSRVMSPGAELDPSPRGQAGTREELDGVETRLALPSGNTRLAAKLPG